MDWGKITCPYELRDVQIKCITAYLFLIVRCCFLRYIFTIGMKYIMTFTNPFPVFQRHHEQQSFLPTPQPDESPGHARDCHGGHGQRAGRRQVTGRMA